MTLRETAKPPHRCPECGATAWARMICQNCNYDAFMLRFGAQMKARDEEMRRVTRLLINRGKRPVS